MLDDHRTLARKAWRDLGRHRARSILVLLAIALGLMAAGAVLNAWALVQRATELGYRASLPVSATLTVEQLGAEVLLQVRALPAIAAARLRLSLGAQAQSGGGGWLNARIYALDDFSDVGMARLQADGGAWPPGGGQVLIERSSLEFSGATVGEPLLLKVGDGEPVSLAVAGLLRDVSLAPGWMEHVVYGYTTPANLERLGLRSAATQELQIRVRDAGADRQAVRRIAAEVKRLVERSGGRVTAVDVPEPGQHIHAAQMDSLLLTQGAFGLLALGVCGFLVVNLISTMLAGQAREIGILKVLGAGPGQVAGLYLGQALLLGLAASAIALPAAALIGRQYGELKAQMLNFPLAGFRLPAWALLLQLGVGCLLPVLAAAGPVWRACRQPVGASLRDIGIVPAGQAMATRRLPPAMGWLGRPLLLALGNAFRRRQRMALTLLALAAAGAVFLGAANLREGVRGSVALLYAANRFDVQLRLAEPQAAQKLEAAALAVPGIRAAEAWRGRRATLAQADGLDDSFTVLGLPPASAMLKPVMLEGRWLREGEQDGLVVNRAWLRQHAGLRLGSSLTLTISGQSKVWQVLGTVDTGPQALAYAARTALGDEATTLVVSTEARAGAMQMDALQALRTALAAAGMQVASSHLQSEGRRVMEDHLLMVVEFLGAMAWVMIAVGGMGLASTMGMAVLERTREIGVLRALGARDRTVMGLVQTEGLVIVGLAWALSLPLSAPMSLLLGRAFGKIMFEVPVSALPSATAAGQWLLLMLVVSLLACAWPAWQASRISAARALSYE